jgi:phosphoserine phosphatase RsbU/P
VGTEAARNLLRSDLGGLVLSLIIFLAGLGALVVQLWRRRSRDRTLLWFGLFVALYGLRALERQPIVRLAWEFPAAAWNYLDSVINNGITTPALLFVQQVYGAGWKSSLRWLLWMQAAWGAAALLADVLSGQPFLAPDPSTLLIIGFPLIVIAGYVYGYRPPWSSGTHIIFAGGGVFLLSVMVDHLSREGWLPWSVLTEPFGFFFNLGCLAYVAVEKFVSTEQQLVAMQEEMRSASRIQSSILPSGAPRVPGLQMAVRYAPMTAVAGDFYDFLPAANGGIGILVADVTGHGVPAALVASMVKVAAASQSEHADDPARVIAALNQVMCRQVHGQFTTAGYLYLDPASGTGRYAAAGHPPLLRYRAHGGGLEEFRENGLLMGVRATEKYASTPLSLQPGDRLLLYTDGIPEALNSAGEFFGEERFKEFIETHADLAAEAFAEALTGKLAAWSGSGTRGAQSDDRTLVVVDVTPAQARPAFPGSNA